MTTDSTVAAPTTADGEEFCYFDIHAYRLFTFVLWSVGAVVCILGFVGNLIAFNVFQKDLKKTSISFLFQVCGAVAERRPDLCMFHINCNDVGSNRSDDLKRRRATQMLACPNSIRHQTGLTVQKVAKCLTQSYREVPTATAVNVDVKDINAVDLGRVSTCVSACIIHIRCIACSL